MKDLNKINCSEMSYSEMLNTDGGTDGGKGVVYQLGAWLGRLIANISDADHSTYMKHNVGPGIPV